MEVLQSNAALVPTTYTSALNESGRFVVGQWRRKDAGLSGNPGQYATPPLTGGIMHTEAFPDPHHTNQAGDQVSMREFAQTVDERLSHLHQSAAELSGRLELAETSIRRMAGQSHDARGRRWSGTLQDALAYEPARYEQHTWTHLITRREETLRDLEGVRAEQGELNEVYESSGRWTRAFLVDGSDGHVHSSMQCSSCYPTTQFVWLPQYSGADEREIVEAAGRSACTRCYPTAPVDVLSRPSTITNPNRPTPDTNNKTGKRTASTGEPDQKTVNKSPTASGEPLRIPEMFSDHGVEVLKTERSAIVAWNDSTDYLGMVDEDLKPGLLRRRVLIEEALAAKNGVTVEQQRAVLETKYAKRRTK